MNEHKLNLLVAKLGTGVAEEDEEVRIRAAASLTYEHPDWSFVAAKLFRQQLTRKIEPLFSEAMKSIRGFPFKSSGSYPKPVKA